MIMMIIMRRGRRFATHSFYIGLEIGIVWWKWTIIFATAFLSAYTKHSIICWFRWQAQWKQIIKKMQPHCIDVELWLRDEIGSQCSSILKKTISHAIYLSSKRISPLVFIDEAIFERTTKSNNWMRPAI